MTQRSRGIPGLLFGQIGGCHKTSCTNLSWHGSHRISFSSLFIGQVSIHHFRRLMMNRMVNISYMCRSQWFWNRLSWLLCYGWERLDQCFLIDRHLIISHSYGMLWKWPNCYITRGYMLEIFPWHPNSTAMLGHLWLFFLTRFNVYIAVPATQKPPSRRPVTPPRTPAVAMLFSGVTWKEAKWKGHHFHKIP